MELDQNPQQPQNTQPTPPVPQAAPQQPQRPGGEDPGNITAIIGLIVGFLVFPLIGLIVCIVANNQSKKAGFNNSLAKIGMWIHGVLTALFVLFIIVMVIIAVATSTSHSY